MLKKQQRLTKKEFDAHFSSGKRIHSPLLQLIYTAKGDFHGAAVVGKKVHKKAVDRNKMRRRLYSILYAHMKEAQLKGVYIVIAKPAAKEASYDNLKTELTNVLSRVS